MSDLNPADVVRAHSLLMGIGPGYDEIRDIVRRVIAGLQPDAADAAIVAFFHEIEVCDGVLLEKLGFRVGDDDATSSQA